MGGAGEEVVYPVEGIGFFVRNVRKFLPNQAASVGQTTVGHPRDLERSATCTAWGKARLRSTR